MCAFMINSQKIQSLFSPIFLGDCKGKPGEYFDLIGDFDVESIRLLGICKRLQDQLKLGNEDLRMDYGITLLLLYEQGVEIGKVIREEPPLIAEPGENPADVEGEGESSLLKPEEGRDIGLLLKALEELKKAAQLNIDAHYPLARMYYDYREVFGETISWSAVVNHLREALKVDPENALAHYYLGQSILQLVEQESHENTVEAFTAYLEAGAPEGHEKEVKEFINASNRDWKIADALERGKRLLREKKYDESVKALYEAINLGDTEAYYFLGKVQVAAGNMNRAIDAFQNAIDANVEKEDLDEQLGKAIFRLYGSPGAIEKGIRSLAKSLGEKNLSTAADAIGQAEKKKKVKEVEEMGKMLSQLKGMLGQVTAYKNGTAYANNQVSVFALVVGIDAYQAPLSPLTGCLNDVEQIETYLTRQFTSGLHLHTLRNKEATLENIVKEFQEHLYKAEPEDTVWFHFSGYGTEAYSAAEFLSTLPAGKDRCLLCYSGKENEYALLADKELAVLLAGFMKEGNPASLPRIVVSLDCSYGIDLETKPVAMHPRTAVHLNPFLQQKENDEMGTWLTGRTLDEYAEGYYQQQWEANGKLTIPETRHILFTASQGKEAAMEVANQGVFTSSLISALEETKGSLNYADLLHRTRNAVQAMNGEYMQTPQLRSRGNFDPFTLFLEDISFGTSEPFYVYKQGPDWKVDCGLVDGIPANSSIPVEVEIQRIDSPDQVAAKGVLTRIGLQTSRLKISEELDESVTYQGFFNLMLKPSVKVWMHGHTDAVAHLRAAWDASKRVVEVARDSSCDVEIECTEQQFLIKDRKRNSNVIQVEADANGARATMANLGKMANWERIISLDNETSRIKDLISLEIEITHKNGDKKIFMSPKAHLIVSESAYEYASDEPIRIGLMAQCRLNLRVNPNPDQAERMIPQKLYAYMLFLGEDYGIEAVGKEMMLSLESAQREGKSVIPMWPKPARWELKPDEEQAPTYLKLIVATERFNIEQLVQKKIGASTRSVRTLAMEYFDTEVDWCSDTIALKMERIG